MEVGTMQRVILMRRHVVVRKAASFAADTPPELSTINGWVFGVTRHFAKLIRQKVMDVLLCCRTQHMIHNQIHVCGFVACIAFIMPDQLKKYKLTHSEKKKKEERTEKWKRSREEAKAQDESQEEPEDDEDSVISPPPLRRSSRFNE